MAVSEKDVLLKISQATSRISNLEQLLKTSVRISAQAMGVDRCAIWLTDNQRKFAEIKAVYVKGRSGPVHLGSRIDLSKFPKFKRIITEKRIIHSPDISKAITNRFEKEFFTRAKIKSSLSVPLKLRAKVLGGLNFETLKCCKTFTPSEKRLAQVTANQIVVGIEHARLYKELSDRAVQVQEQSIKVLRESEEKYRTLLENLPQMIFLKDKNSVYVSANRNFCSALGIKSKEFKGKTDFDFFPKKLAQKYRKDDREVIRTRKTKEIIEDYIEKGKRKIVQTVKTPVLGDDGKPIGVLGIFWDVTERKESEQIQSVLYKIAESVHRVKDLKELFITIHKVLGIVLDTTNFYIALYDKNSDTISLPYYVDQKDKFTSFPAKKTLTAYVIKNNKPLLVTQAVRKKLIESGKVETIGARSKIWLGVPLKVGGEVMGVIVVQSYTNPLAYGKRELEILKYVSTQIANAVQRKKTEDLLIWNERIARERAKLLTNLRSLDEIDNILTRVCRSVRDSGLFQRAVMTINKPGGEIIHLGQVGLPAAVIQRARKASPLDPRLRARLTDKRFRISDSFFVPVEAGLDLSKTSRYIPQKIEKSIEGDWQAGDELFVPLRNFTGMVMGYLSVDTPTDGSRPDRKTIEALEMLVEVAASRIREVEAQNAIKKERDFSKSVIETANSLIICLDHDARITAFNHECERVTGYSREEVLGKRWPELFLPPEHRHIELKSFAKWVRAHPRDQYEGPIKTKNGEIRTILWSNTAILGPGKKDMMAIAVGQDITERKKAVEALRESKETAQAMLNASLDGVLLINPDGTIAALNEALAKGLGKTREELVGASVFDILPPDIAQHRMTQAMKAVRSKKPIRFVDEREGRIFDQSVYPVLNAQGKVVRIAVFTYDITEQKKAEEALRESEGRYRSLFEDSPISLWEEDFSQVKVYLDKLKKAGVKDFNSYFRNYPKIVEKCTTMVKILDVNHPTLKLFKTKNKEELKRGLRKTFLKESYEAFRDELVAIANGKTIFETEAVTQNLKGEKKNILIRWTVAPGCEQTFSKVLVSIVDITEHKKADEALKESQKFLNDIIDHIPDPIFIKNRKHQWILLNKAICEMLGYPREEMLGKSDYDFFPKKQADFFWKKDEEMFRTGKVIDIPEEPITDAQGNIHWLYTKKAPLKDPSNKIGTLVGIIRDITDQKKAVEALRKSRDLNTILQISYKITQIHDLNKMLKLACQELTDALQVDRCSVSLIDEEQKMGQVKAIYEENQPHPEALGQRFSLFDFPRVLRLYQRGERFAHCAPNIEKSNLSEKEKDYFKQLGVKSFVVVPIDTGKRLLGILLVSSMKKERVFSESEITFVQTLANHLAVAIQNVRLMDMVKEQAENVEILSQRVITAQEEERKRIAQQLHDEISQDLALMKINTEITRKNVPAELDQVIQRIKDNENLTIQTLNKVRDLTSYLRPPLLDDLGLVETLKWYIKEFSRRTNIEVTFISDKYQSRLHQDLEMVLYRIAQEALANVAKHAQAVSVSILLEKKNNSVVLAVKDDGIGFDVKKVLREQKMKRGFGLFSMEERVKLLDGSFKLTSKLKKGTSLEVRLPCPKGR